MQCSWGPEEGSRTPGQALLSTLKFLALIFIYLFFNFVGQKDYSVIKNACCLCRGPEFYSRHQHGGRQQPVAQSPRGQKLSEDSLWELVLHV